MNIAGMLFNNALGSVLAKPFSEQDLFWQISDIQLTDIQYLKFLFAVFLTAPLPFHCMIKNVTELILNPITNALGPMVYY